MKVQNDFLTALRSIKSICIHEIPASLLFSLLFFIAFGVYYVNGVTLGIGDDQDSVVYYYWGQQVLDGYLPYVSVIDHKGPLSGFIVGIAILWGRLFDGADDLLSTMHIFMLNNALCALLIFYLTKIVSNSNLVALVAYGVFLFCYPLALETMRGPEPKALVMTFQLLILWCIIRSHWFFAGIFSMFCILTWQPSGGLLVAVAYIMLRYKSPLRHYIYYLPGLVLPLAAMVALYVFKGQLTYLYDGLLGINLIDMPKYDRGFSEAYYDLHKYYRYGGGWIILLGCSFGVASFLLRCKVHDRSAEQINKIISFCAIAVLFWLIWTSYNYIQYRRLFLFVPFGAIGFAVLLQYINAKTICIKYHSYFLPIVLMLLIMGAYYEYAPLRNSKNYDHDKNLAKRVYAATGYNNDVMSCHALIYPAILGIRDKYNPFVRNTPPSLGQYIDWRYSGGRREYMHKIMGQKPQVIISTGRINWSYACPFITNRKAVTEWEKWIHENYNKYKDNYYVYYLRKDTIK